MVVDILKSSVVLVFFIYKIFMSERVVLGRLRVEREIVLVIYFILNNFFRKFLAFL